MIFFWVASIFEMIWGGLDFKKKKKTRSYAWWNISLQMQRSNFVPFYGNIYIFWIHRFSSINDFLSNSFLIFLYWVLIVNISFFKKKKSSCCWYFCSKSVWCCTTTKSVFIRLWNNYRVFNNLMKINTITIICNQRVTWNPFFFFFLKNPLTR